MKANDILCCVGSAAALLLASALIPFVGPLLSLLTPIPFLFYATKLGLKEGVKLAALTTVILGALAALTGQVQVMIFCVELALLGLLLSELFRRGLGLGQTIFWATAFLLLLGLTMLYAMSSSKDMGPIEMVLHYLQSHLDASIHAYEQMGISEQQIQELKAYSKAFMGTISNIYPALSVIGTGFAVWFNVMVARPLFRFRHLPYPDFGPADRWRAPENLVWVLIASGFALFLTDGIIKLWAINALIILMAVYFFHGLSIMLFFMNRYRLPSWIRIGIYFFIIIQKVFVLACALAGLFDQWIDLRKIHRRIQR